MKHDDRVDLLLLNASNQPSAPVFPYAFVQVSAVARRFGVKVARFDFLDLPKTRWRSVLVDLLNRHRPRMVGLHLRQADSVVAFDYLPPPEGAPALYYLPVEETRALLQRLRALTDVPIVIGGFGFSAHAMQTARTLAVDYGIQGEPDGFFERFEDVLARRRLDRVPNLIYRQGRGYRANARVFYPPAPGGEYDDAIIAELIYFYGKQTLLSVPVEFARGCPHHCCFCNEPAVKGRKVRIRDWSAIEEDLLRLDRHGIRRVWMVCSEINVRPRAALELAGRMAALNKRRKPARRFRWYSYNIPHMRPADLRFMLSAGFEPGWNDFPSFEDRNLDRCRVPFQSKTALAYYRCFLDWADAQPVPPKDRQTFFLFLGNPHADARTISTTLRQVERHGLQARHKVATVGPATRVFEIDGKLTCGSRRTLRSVGRKGVQAFDIVSPTFFYPPKLVKHLGSPKAVRDFLAYVAATFLSTGYELDRNWSRFLAESISPTGLLALMRGAKSARLLKPVPMAADDGRPVRKIERALARIWARLDAKTLRRLFSPGKEKDVYDHVAHAVLVQLLGPHSRRFKPVLRSLGIPHNRDGFHSLSPYALAEILYRRYRSNDELIREVCRAYGFAPDSIDRLALQFLLYQSNIRIRSEYRKLLFG
jgi:hypothetical protein